MDSNRKYIDPKKFGRNTKKIKTSTTNDLLEIINTHDFSNTRHIIISTGKNDTDEDEAENICQKLIKAAKRLKAEYNDAYVYLSHIPPRKYLKQNEVAKVNTLLSEATLESISLICHNNLTESMLQDDKHISETHIKNMVRNIKDTMRSVTNYRPDDTNEYKNNRGKN